MQRDKGSQKNTTLMGGVFLGVLPENEPLLKTLILGEFVSPFLTVDIIA